VKRNAPEDVRKIPELLAVTALAVQEGGCDFLGQVVGDLGLITGHMGQFFTPYDVSRMIAEMTLDTVDEIIAEQGFVTVQEPACGAGGMVIAAADVLARRGHQTICPKSYAKEPVRRLLQQEEPDVRQQPLIPEDVGL
jgi:hypothetical protein